MDHILPAAVDGVTSPFMGLPSSEGDFADQAQWQYAWDSVSLTSALSCPRQYYYRSILGLQPRNPNYAIALRFGILFHEGLEEYHRQRAKGVDHQPAVENVVKRLLGRPDTADLPTDDDIEEIAADIAEREAAGDDDDGITLRNSKVRTRYHLIRSVVWYLEHYKDDPFETLILPSGKPAVELSFRVDLGIECNDTPLMLCGHIDRAVRFQGGVYPTDYKTTKSLTRQFFDAFSLSHQFTGYMFAGDIILEQPIAGAWIDGAALMVGGAKFRRAPTTRSPGQMREYLSTVSYIAHQAYGWAATLANTGDAGEAYPMNTSACYFCEFKQLCAQATEYRDKYQEKLFLARPEQAWNPLRAR